MAKVLILDQSKSMRNTLRERLEFEGFSTEAAEDEEAASTMCEKIPFDVILSDRGCKIPDAGIPFIVLSAEASIDSAVEAVRNGAQDYHRAGRCRAAETIPDGLDAAAGGILAGV